MMEWAGCQPAWSPPGAPGQGELTGTRKYATMSVMPKAAPDFRTNRSESVEGRAVAVGRWRSYHYALEEDVIAEAFSSRPEGSSLQDLDPEIQDDIAADAVERSELIGFWVAWHLAGGFANLERGGWHRATIFRKVRRFRAAFGAHPDEYTFPWIQLDLRAAWKDQLERQIEANRGRGLIG